MKTRISIVLFIFFTSYFAQAQNNELLQAFEGMSYTSESGGILPYRLLKPLEYDASKKYPLVIFLHGSGERGSDNEAQLKNAVSSFLQEDIRKKYPSFVLVPQCPEGDRWSPFKEGDEAEKFWLSESPSETMKLLLELINYTQETYSIDQKRVYATGLSMGGQGTYDLLIRNPDTFAAAVVVCSFSDIREAKVIANTPIWIFHGEEDQVVPIDNARVMVNALESVGAKLKYTEYPDTNHNSWDKAFGEEKLYSWLFKKKL